MYLLTQPLIIFTLSLFTCTIGHSQEHSNLIQYVWAINGQNIRVQPTTKSPISHLLSFGDSIVVLSVSDINYNSKLMDVDTFGSLESHPVILKGKWIKVRTSDGIIGYTINTFLLPFEPAHRQTYQTGDINIPLLSTDTTFLSKIMHDGSGHNSTYQYTYAHGITVIQKSGGYWSTDEIILPEFSIREAFVILSVYFGNYQDAFVQRNWKEQISFTFDTICKATLKPSSQGIRLIIGCAC